MTGLVGLLFALQNATPLTIYGVGMFGEQAGHHCGRQTLFPIRCTHPRPLFLCQSCPGLGGNLQGHCPPGETQSFGHTAPPQSQAQTASLLHKSFISYAHLLCLSIFPVPGRHQVFPSGHSQILLAGQVTPYLVSWFNEVWVSVGGSPPAAGPVPCEDLVGPISWLV